MALAGGHAEHRVAEQLVGVKHQPALVTDANAVAEDTLGPREAVDLALDRHHPFDIAERHPPVSDLTRVHRSNRCTCFKSSQAIALAGGLRSR